MVQPGQRLLTATEKYGQVGSDETFSLLVFCSCYDVSTLFRTLQKRSLVCLFRQVHT